MPLPAPLVFAAERAIAAIIALDPDLSEALAALDGRVVRLVVGTRGSSTGVRGEEETTRGVELALSFVDGRVDVFGSFDGSADVTITGPVSALASLADGNDALYRGDVRIDGDVGVAATLSDAIGRLDVDLEDVLAPLVGGTLARRFGQAGHDARMWAGRTRSGFVANVEEYLTEESELLPSAGEVERFANEVDDLRSAADRLDARVRRLERTRSAERADDSDR